MPRKLRLTPQLTDAICQMLEIGTPCKHAALANGINERTFRHWMEQGEAGIVPYKSFFAAVTRARARAVPNMLVKGLEGEKGSSMAAWILERRYSKYFSLKSKDKEKQEVTINIKGGLRESTP